MPKTAPFDVYHERYEEWFDINQAAYISELLALRPFIPLGGNGIEVGVGSGRFAAPLGISIGIDPSSSMLSYAIARGIKGVMGTAEDLPFVDGSFDTAMVVTTICFVDSPDRMLAEIFRVLKPGGRVVIGFIDRESMIGQNYLTHQAESDFYRDAIFYSTDDVKKMLINLGFSITGLGQTLAHRLSETTELEPVLPGSGKCAFVVIAAMKKE